MVLRHYKGSCLSATQLPLYSTTAGTWSTSRSSIVATLKLAKTMRAQDCKWDLHMILVQSDLTLVNRESGSPIARPVDVNLLLAEVGLGHRGSDLVKDAAAVHNSAKE